MGADKPRTEHLAGLTQRSVASGSGNASFPRVPSALSHTRTHTHTHTLSLSATIQGPQNIILGGKTIIQPHSILRGDLRRSGAGGKASVVIALGRYCNIGEGVVVRPPGKCYRG